MSLTRRHILAGAAATAATAALPAAAVEAVEEAPIEWPVAPFVDRQTFFDGRIDWTFCARRREWRACDALRL